VKKKPKAGPGGVSSLKNVTFAGYLYHKGMLSWTQRYCVIADAQLVSYRSEKDSKPVLSLSLFGRDITYTERMDTARFSHAVRVSRPGSEIHWFYTDTRELADSWIRVSYSLLALFLPLNVVLLATLVNATGLEYSSSVHHSIAIHGRLTSCST